MFSPDGKQVASAGFDRRVLTWSPESLKPIEFKKLVEGQLLPHSSSASSLVMRMPSSRSGFRPMDSCWSVPVRTTRFASGMSTAERWSRPSEDMADGYRRRRSWAMGNAFCRLARSIDSRVEPGWESGDPDDSGQVLSGHSDAVLAAAYSKDQSQIVTASRDRSARTWNALTGQPGLTLAEGHSYLASTAVFFPGAKRLLTAAVDNTARIWDVGTGGQVLRLEHTGRSAAAAIARDGRTIITGSDDKTARLWDANTGQELRLLKGHSSEVTAVAFSSDGQLVATGDTKGHVKLWNPATGELRAKLDVHSRRIAALAFSEDGQRLFSASGDNTVSQWAIATGQELPGILKHPDAVLAMQLIPGGSALVTSCADHTIRVWNTAEAQVTLTLGPFAGDAYSLSVTEDGQRLLVANSDQRTVHLWDLSTGKRSSPLSPRVSSGRSWTSSSMAACSGPQLWFPDRTTS